MTGASPRQQDALDFIAVYTQAHGFPPAYDDIGLALGLSSRSTVKLMVDALERKGLVHRLPRQPRTLVIVPQDAA